MTSTAQNFRKPFHESKLTGWRWFFDAINWLWWLARLPMVLLAVPAAYAVGAFSYSDGKLPLIICVFAGLAFECSYIGAIALGEFIKPNDYLGRALQIVLSIISVATSAVYGTLYYSDGKFDDITRETFVHGALLPVIGFFYGTLLHYITSSLVEKPIEYICPKCGKALSSQSALNGHLPHCQPKES
jgi:hypothetical protein